MSQRLPPIATNMSSMADSIDKENPFESTWGVLRALKTEVRELQAALRAEQHMRGTEVMELNRELKALREKCAKDQGDAKADVQKTIDPINAMTRELKDELRKFNMQHDQQQHELNHRLDDEKRDRVADARRLADEIRGEITSRTATTDDLTKKITDTQRDLDVTGSDIRHDVHNLIQDVKLIGDHLIRINSTWQDFRSDKLASHPAHGGGKSPVRVTPSTMASTMTSVTHGWGA